MHIITSFETLGIDLSNFGLDELTLKHMDVNNEDDIRRDLFMAIKSAYDEAVVGTDYYLYENYENIRFLFGAITPAALLEKVDGWNKDILAAIVPALVNAGIVSKDGVVSPEEIQMNTPGTYELKKVVRELNNDWFPLAYHGVYLENEVGFPYFAVQITEKIRSKIREHPEKYFIVEVLPK